MKVILILLFLSDIWLGIVNLKNTKRIKKIDVELMPISCHPKRWWSFFTSENEKNK